MIDLGIADVLNRAADMIRPEGAWIGGPASNDDFARNNAGKEVRPTDADACCWCLYGAIEAAAPTPKDDIAACNLLGRAIGTQFLAIWNHDSRRTQAEVVAALCLAAKMASK